MKRLIVTVGLPRSGKSTWVEELRRRNGWPVVSTDAIRLVIHGHRYLASAEPHVWAAAKTMVPALFLAGHELVVLDACNTTAAQRAQWRTQPWHLTAWECLYKVFPPEPALCKQRAIADGMGDLLDVIGRMAAGWEPLSPEENEYLCK